MTSLFAPLWWLLHVFDVFSAFDFADREDFAPLATLAIGLACAACIFAWSRERRAPASPVLMSTALLLSVWPILPDIGLFFLAREVQRVNGAWPQVMVDDPKNLLGHVSAHYEKLFSLVVYLEAFSGAWMLIFLALLCQKHLFSGVQRRLIAGACAASVIAFVLDFGGLYSWWLD